MGKVAKLKTLIEIFAKNDGSVKTELGKTSKQIDDLRKKASETATMPDMHTGQGADEAMQQAAQRASSVTQKIKALGESVQSAGFKMQSLGTKLMPASLGAQGLITASVKMANDFDNGMAKVNTIARLSDDKLSALSKSLLRVSNQTGQSATDIAEAAYQSLSASVPTDQVAKFTKTAANLAKTGFTDTASAVDVLSTAINAYGLKTSEASKLSDMLIQTQNRGKITVNELAAQMGNIIPNASALGVNMANLSTGYVQLTKQGINAATSTTELKRMFNELSKSGSGVSKVLKKQTGKDFTTLMKSGKSLGDVMQILGDSVKGNKTEFKNLWSNSSAGAGALALLNAGSKDFNKQLGDMNNSTGNVSKALNNLNTRGAKSKKAINELKNSGIELGETFMDAASPAINEVTKSVGVLTDKFSKLPQSEKNAVAGATALVAVASPVLIGVGKIVSGLGNMIIKTASATGKVIKFTAALKESGPGSLRAVQSLQKYIKYVKALPSATEHAAAGEHTFTAYLASSGAVAGTTIAAVAALSAVMLSQRHNFQASSKEVDSLTKKYDSAADKTDSLIASSEAQISASKKQNNAMITNGAVANDLASKIKKLRSVENKSSLQKKELKADVLALNKVIPGLNLKYNEEKDQLSKTNEKIAENIKLLKQQSIAKAAAKNASGLTDKLGELKLQQSSNSVNLAEQGAKVDELRKKQQAALARSRKLDADPTASAADKNEAMKKLSQYTSALSKAENSYDRLKTKQSQLNKEIANVNKNININSFNSAIAKARADGKKIPDALAAGMKSTMKVLPATTQELTTAIKYKTVINKAKDAGIKIPTALSQKIVTGKVTVKKAESQLNSIIKFDGAVKKAKKQGVKIPSSLASGVDSGKITAKQASDRLAQVVKFDKAVKKAKKQGSKTANSLAESIASGKITTKQASDRLAQVIKFDKAVKKAKKQGVKIPKGLAASVAAGKMTAQQASAMLGNASTSKLDKSKDAKSKGTKTNKSFSNSVGQTSAPRSAGQRASNAGVQPFTKVPNRVATALAGLSAKIHDAFQFTPPHIPVPHPKWHGHFDLKKGTVPTISMNWYKNGGIMTRPTVFGASGNKLLAGGEAGPEGIIPLNKLWKNMDRAIASTVNTNVKNIYNDAGSLAQASTSNKTVNVNNYRNYNNNYNNYTKNYNSDSNFAKNVQNSSFNNKISALTAKSVTNLANSALSNDRVYRISKSNALANRYKTLSINNDVANSTRSVRSSVLNEQSLSNAKTIANLVNSTKNTNRVDSRTNSAVNSSALSNDRVYSASNTKSIRVSSALDKSISMISTIANIAKLASVVTAPVTKILDQRKSKSNVVSILDVKRGEMPRPVSFKNDDSIKGKNLTNILKTGSLSFDLGATPQEMSSNITTNAKSRSVSNNYSSARSIANSRANSTNKSINISGITFAPNIVIKGSAKKQDIIDALKEVEDEFKDYLKEITDDEEESYYA